MIVGDFINDCDVTPPRPLPEGVVIECQDISQVLDTKRATDRINTQYMRLNMGDFSLARKLAGPSVVVLEVGAQVALA
jgi:hypothetical protein